MTTRPPIPPTREEDEPAALETARRLPGVVVLFAGGVPVLEVTTMAQEKLVIGREGAVRIGDDLVSREHAEVSPDARPSGPAGSSSTKQRTRGTSVAPWAKRAA